jgi:hypothetical protein
VGGWQVAKAAVGPVFVVLGPIVLDCPLGVGEIYKVMPGEALTSKALWKLSRAAFSVGLPGD